MKNFDQSAVYILRVGLKKLIDDRCLGKIANLPSHGALIHQSSNCACEIQFVIYFTFVNDCRGNNRQEKILAPLQVVASDFHFHSHLVFLLLRRLAEQAPAMSRKKIKGCSSTDCREFWPNC